MNRSPFSILSLLLLAGLLLPANLLAGHKSSHLTLHCASEQLLCDFNKRLELGPRLSYLVKNKDILTVEDEVTAKFNVILEQAKVILNMFPKNLHVKVVILPTTHDCSSVFARKFGKRERRIAYYCLSEDTIYISAKDTRLGVIAHELAHAIIDFYFSEQPPYHVHELMAQAVETHIDDNDELIATYRRMDENAATIRHACSSYAIRND